MEEKQRPKVGVGVIVIKNNKVLLGLRKGSHAAGTWAFPGGHLEMWESLKNCALRELEEEAGIKTELIDEHSVAATNDFFETDNKHYITLYLRAKYLEGEPKILEPEKCEKWEWFSWDSLPENSFIGIKNLIKQNFNPF